MNFKPYLILGTAEFGHANYFPFPEKKEIVRILNLAWEAGIEWLDTSDSYNIEILEPYFNGFKRLFKSVRDKDAFYHYRPAERPIPGVTKASVYDLDQMNGLKEAIVPYSISNTLFLDAKAPKLYIRSVFDNGRLLEEGYSIKDCLDFVKRQPVTGVIVGVRSVKELEEILNVY